MTTYKRATGNIVFETINANSTVSFVGPTANAVSVVINGDLSVSGNASLTGNIAGDRIFNGNSSIEIPVASGNANISIGGTSNVLVVSNTGIAVTGAANISGNATIGNLNVTGIIAGNVVFGNVDTTGNVIITRDASVGQPTIRFNDTDTTLAVSTVLGAVEWYTSDASPGARVTTAVRSIATSATGNARYEILTSTDGAAATAKFVVDNVGNVGIANNSPLHALSTTGDTYTSGAATVVGNVTGGNISTAGRITATGNIVSSGNIAGGNLSVTGNVTANNVNASFAVTAGAGGVSATGNVTGGNVISQGLISATGNLTTTDIFATTLSASGNVTGGNLVTGGVANTGSVTATSTISAAGNITGGNLRTGGSVSATGNVIGGNVTSSGLITAAGNIVAGAYFVGDGGYLSNVTAVSNLAVSQLANGATNLTVRSSTGPITADVNGVANVISISDTQFISNVAVSASGNITGGNLLTAGRVSATGNVDGGNVNATIGNFNTVIGVANASNLTTGTVPSDRLTGIYTINISGYATTVSAAAQPNITSVGNMSSLSVVGNTTTGNLITGGLISAQGNITGGNIVSTTSGQISTNGNVTGGNVITGTVYTNVGSSGVALVNSGTNATGNIGNASGYFGNAFLNTVTTSGAVSAAGNVTGAFLLGNITFATGYNASKIFNGTSEANIGVANGNANISIGGTSNVVVVANTGVIVTGLATASGNVTGGNIITGGLITATGNISGGNVNTAIVSASGNVSAANFSTAGLITATGNVTGGNLVTAGIANTGSLTATTTVSAAGNVTGGNLITGGLVTATGSITTANQFVGNGAGLTNLNASNISSGTLAQARLANSSLTVNGTAIALGASGTVTANTPSSLTFNSGGTGDASGSTFNGGTAVTVSYNTVGAPSTTGANASGTWSISINGSANSASTATSATTAGTVTTAAQPNITSVGTLTGLTVSGSIGIGTNTITVGNILNGNGNGVGNIGNSTTYFNTVFAKATSAQYADLAEKFVADQLYMPGTVLIFGGAAEVTESFQDADSRVAGVVSTNPSYIMNSGLDHDFAVELALQGRVPCFVTGPVVKGDLLVSAPGGRARAVKSAQAGTIIGKSLENFYGESGLIEIVVGRC